MSVDIVARLRPKADRLAEFESVLGELVAATQLEAGNLEYRVFRSDQDGVIDFIVRESYLDRDAHMVHRETEHYQGLVPTVIACLEGPIEAHSLSPLVVPIQTATDGSDD